jgi:hypothetical protein
VSEHVGQRDSHTLPGAALEELMSAALARGASFRFTARGFSMHPFVRDGDVLMLGAVARRLRVGDVVAARCPAPGGLLVHRVVARAGTGLLVRGDGSGEADGVVGPADVLAVVVGVERAGQAVRFGLGPERWLVAGLSRGGLLVPLVSALRRVRAGLRRGGRV